MEGRDAMVKYIEERRTKALSPRSELESLCFRSSLFTISFEPCMSAFQGKINQIIPSLSVELQLVCLNEKLQSFHIGNIVNSPTNKTTS